MSRVNKGIRFEYKIRDQLRKEGYYVIRSAGSHGLFDLIAVHRDKRHILFLQLKRGSKRYVFNAKKEYECEWINGALMAEFKIIEHIDE